MSLSKISAEPDPTPSHFQNEMPKVSYTVSANDDIFKYNALSKKVARVAWLLFSIIILPVGIVRLIGRIINHIATNFGIVPALRINKDYLDEERAAFLRNCPYANHCKRLTIQTADHVKLDTMMINSPNQENKAPEDRKYIIFFNGNATTYEEMFETLMRISMKTDANVFCGNYRGVGYSEGFPRSFQDLVMDGEAMVQYLLHQGVRPENILIHGWSLGSGVGAHVAALHQEQGHEVHFCSDRSFASLAIEVNELLHNLNKIIRHIAVGMIRILGWNFKSLKCYKKINGHKFIIYHRDDTVIPYTASLYKGLKNSEMTELHKKQKQERKELKQRMANEGKEYVSEKHTRPYRPKHVIRLDHLLNHYPVHGIPIEKTPHFENYKDQVAIALG